METLLNMDSLVTKANSQAEGGFKFHSVQFVKLFVVLLYIGKLSVDK